MEITIGHTPDADDAFMFHGIVSGRIALDNVNIKHVIEDIESLNRKALNNELDLTAVSAHAYAYMKDYIILRSGSSFGRAYGPIVIAKERYSVDELKKIRIAVPGKMTTAYLLIRMAIGDFNAVEMKFNEITNAVERGVVDAGLVIHEAQITYDKATFVNTLDLGLWWDNISNKLPLPLGINVAHKRLGNDLIRKLDDLLKRSIQYGFSNLEETLDYAMQYARGASRYLIEQFVRMYVNDLTIDMGEQGIQALQMMYSIAKQKNIVKDVEVMII
ncbi:MAG: MqnA/MqnD/SBP family protein [Nitrososphaerales archaeon]